MKIKIRTSAIRDLKKLDQNQKNKIHAAIKKLHQYPDINHVKKLTNFEPAYRLRVGDYRILFDIFDNTIEVGRVLHRRESY